MIVFRCLLCSLGNLSAEVLTYPQCGLKVFEAQYRTSPEPEPHQQTIAEMISFSAETAKPTTEEKSKVTGSSASLIKQTDSTGKDFMHSYEDSTHGIGKPDMDCRGSEDADKTNFCASYNRLGQEQLSQNVSQDLIVKKTILPEIQNTFGHLYGLNARDNDKLTPSSFNFFQNPVCSSNVEPQHQTIFSDSLSSNQYQSQSFPEMTIEKQKFTYSSGIQYVEGNMSFTCSPHFESHTSMLKSYPESGITKSELKTTGDQGNNSSPDLLNKIGNSSSKDTKSEDLKSVNKVAHQEAHTSDPPTRMEGLEKVSAFLEKSSSASISTKFFICYKCSKYCTSESALDIHVQSNCDPNPYKCDQCPMKWDCRSALIRHQVVHSTEWPFECDQCDYATNYKSSLKRHKEMKHGKLISC